MVYSLALGIEDTAKTDLSLANQSFSAYFCFQDENENFSPSILCFELRIRIYSNNQHSDNSFAPRTEISFFQSRAFRRELELRLSQISCLRLLECFFRCNRDKYKRCQWVKVLSFPEFFQLKSNTLFIFLIPKKQIGKKRAIIIQWGNTKLMWCSLKRPRIYQNPNISKSKNYQNKPKIFFFYF